MGGQKDQFRVDEGRGQKAQAIIKEGETRMPRSLSVEWRPDAWTLSMKGRPKVQDISEWEATFSEEETRTGHSHESCSAVSDTRHCQ